MSNQNVERAIWLAGKIAKAEATGQPMLAELYEKNMMQAMREARAEIAAERIRVALAEIMEFLGKKITAGFEMIIKSLTGIEQVTPEALAVFKSDYALVGPGEGRTA